jgi:hypothetical protein
MNINRLIKEAVRSKKESKESTTTASSGSFAPKLSMWSEDEVAKSEYKRKKPIEGEFKEATSTSSNSIYDANSFEDINMNGNKLKGSGRSWKKTQIPGGSYVEIDKKCKTFPYCSQGNSKDKPVKLKKTPSPLQEAIKNVSNKVGLSEKEIKSIIIKHLGIK